MHIHDILPGTHAAAVDESCALLVDALRVQLDLEALSTPGAAYRHMGALIVDASLQAGLRYETVVAPRVRRVLETWPTATTTSAFLSCCLQWGIADVIRWQHPDKLARVFRIAITLSDAGVETVDELAMWAPTDPGRAALLSIHGVGPKTADYVARLAGAPSVAIDRHLVSFATFAGVRRTEYGHLAAAYRAAAVSLEVDLSALDQQVWKLMATLSGPPAGPADGAARKRPARTPVPARGPHDEPPGRR